MRCPHDLIEAAPRKQLATGMVKCRLMCMYCFKEATGYVYSEDMAFFFDLAFNAKRNESADWTYRTWFERDA